MEVFKDFVKFNRYKSVESFNNATDITSSTISIVKLDDNIMDIYLGRTQLTHSNFPEVNIELRNLIDSLNVKLNNIKTEFDSNLSSLNDEHKKELSKYISNFEDGLKNLTNYTNNLSKEVYNIKSDIQNKYNYNEQQIKDIEKSISDINILLSNQNGTIYELSKKIDTVSSNQSFTTNNIRNLEKDVTALQHEDIHIFELINGVKEDIKKIYNNSNSDKNHLNDISDRVSQIENVNGNIINVDIKSLKDKVNKINTNLSRRLNITENDIVVIKNNISQLEDYIKNIDSTNVDITPIISEIDTIKQNINYVSNELLEKIKTNISNINKLKTKDIEFVNDISDIKLDIVALHNEDIHIFEILNELKTINELIKEDNNKINNEILSIKEKIQYLTGVDVDSFETLRIINKKIQELESADKSFQNKIDDINGILKDSIDSKLEWLIL